MAVALVAHTLTTGSSSGGTSPAVDTTGASLLVFSIAQQGTDVTVSDSKTNSWTGLTVYGSTTKCRIFYVASPIVGTGHTFTVSGTSTFSIGFVAAFSGVKLTTPFESQSGATGTTTIQAGSVTPAENGALVIAALAGGATFSTLSLTIGSGFTRTDAASYITSTNYGGALAYLVQSTAAAVNPTWNPASGTPALTATNAVFAPAVAATAVQARVMVMA